MWKLCSYLKLELTLRNLWRFFFNNRNLQYSNPGYPLWLTWCHYGSHYYVAAWEQSVKYYACDCLYVNVYSYTSDLFTLHVLNAKIYSERNIKILGTSASYRRHKKSTEYWPTVKNSVLTKLCSPQEQVRL